MRTRMPAAAAAMIAAMFCAPASPGYADPASDAAAFPNRLVRIVVPFAAGSNTDGQARILADRLGDLWKQQVIVENRPGNSGTGSVARSAPDGYTLLFVSSGHAIANALHRNLPFDVLTDFSAVIQVSSVPLAIVTPPGFPGNTIGSFVALARKMPGKLNYASSGVSSQSYLAAEVFKQAAGIDVLHLPYKGAPDAMTSVMRGDSQLYFLGVNLVPGLVEGGKVQVLAVASPSRVALLPNVQTTAEAGLPDFSFEAWFGLVAPAGTPKEVLGKLYGDISRVLRMGDVQEKMTGQGLLVSGRTGEEFDALIRSEAERYGAMLRRAGVGEN